MEECCVHKCDYKSHDNLAFFKFPASATLFRKWQKAVGRNTSVADSSLVCSRHFREDDMTVYRGKKRLKSKVVPSVFSETNSPRSPAKTVDCDIPAAGNKIEETKENHRETAPDADAPEADAPEADAPEADAPEVDAPEVDAPEADAPEADAPEADAREADAPEADAPAITKRTLRKRNANGISSTCILDYFTSDSDTDSDSDSDNRTKRKRKVKNRKCVRNKKKVSDDISNGDKVSDLGKKEGEVLVNGVGGNVGSDAERTDSVVEENSTECNILVTPSIEFFYDHDDAATEAEPDGARPDIEDILTNYQIAQNNIHIGDDPEDILASTVIKTTDKNKITDNRVTVEVNFEKNTAVILPNEGSGLPANEKSVMAANVNGVSDIDVNSNGHTTPRPEFIEVAVGGWRRGGEGEGAGDCMMLLENMQVEVDPALLQLQDLDSDVDVVERKEEPISLVTSSDESDVIIQEPHIDTVEVSSVDEDDEPLTRLIKPKAKPQFTLQDVAWRCPEFHCYHCKYTTKRKMDFNRHVKMHSVSSDVVYLMCDICDYTTSSPIQLSRHKRAHKDDKKFKCNLCSFRAKHKMSLTYHMQEHDLSKKTEHFSCHRCGNFETDEVKKIERHWRNCGEKKKYNCKRCMYKTDRRRDMDRHVTRVHKTRMDSSSDCSD